MSIGRGTVGELRQDVLGAAAETVVRVAVAEAAPAPGRKLDHRQELLDSLEAVQTLTKNADHRIALQALATKSKLLEQLRELDQAGAAASGPRITYYFPERTELQRLEAPEQ